MLKMIVGLGNPGDKYQHTKHNIGFDVLDELAKSYGAQFSRDKTFMADLASLHLAGEKILLVKPMTFMNESGKAVQPLKAYYGIENDDLLVVYDDLDSPLGRVRLREKGSAGGHNGIKSIIAATGSQIFKRIKVGIGRPTGRQSVSSYVLSTFGKDDLPLVLQGQDKALDAIKAYVEGAEFKQVMNDYNA